MHHLLITEIAVRTCYLWSHGAVFYLASTVKPHVKEVTFTFVFEFIKNVGQQCTLWWECI